MSTAMMQALVGATNAILGWRADVFISPEASAWTLFVRSGMRPRRLRSALSSTEAKGAGGGVGEGGGEGGESVFSGGARARRVAADSAPALPPGSECNASSVSTGLTLVTC